MANNKSRGFALHPKSFDAARLQLARLGAINIIDADEQTPDNTIVWGMYDAGRKVHIYAVKESWAIEMNICDCPDCNGILCWEVRDFIKMEPRQGLFIQLGSDDWENAELAIEFARGFAEEPDS